jgi:hypothetical protein
VVAVERRRRCNGEASVAHVPLPLSLSLFPSLCAALRPAWGEEGSFFGAFFVVQLRFACLCGQRQRLKASKRRVVGNGMNASKGADGALMRPRTGLASPRFLPTATVACPPCEPEQRTRMQGVEH